ncbi:glycosyltransferase family 2 protein [Candidatus Falkowbacteria bacterium]|jgi:GT2 family glycosyltransferase|nr:glycosyltransferase family 2 protein [Candidatus Falkowbacteria bacterium]MBT6573486.1 glycosyltransferase family 2 protein [Candidatus Falkowbacteria bacterium]MBT7501129.1 glycosyltransferase family 2 protein [Candidatus Falkowbacteria bacterium]
MREIKYSIVIVNFNGKEYLERTVRSVLNSNYQNFKIIIVDNNSTDGSVQHIEQTFVKNLAKIKFVQLEKNFGPAKARNEGVKIATGQVYGFLDNDTEVTADWLINADKVFEQDEKVGALQCKLLFLKDKKSIDYVGEYLGSLGFLISIAEYGEPDNGQYDQVKEILAAKSAGMFITRQAFEAAEGFDEDYFIFVEETDLGWRCWLKNYKVVFCPESVVYHHYSATKDITDKKFNNKLVRFHGCKNYILTLYKNLSFKYLVRILPKHIFLWNGLAFYLLFKGNWTSGINILKGIMWFFLHLPANYKKRRRIQKNRKLSDQQLFIEQGLYKKKSIFYFIKRFTDSQKKAVTPENQ